MKLTKKPITVLLMSLTLASCASVPEKEEINASQDSYVVNKSYISAQSLPVDQDSQNENAIRTSDDGLEQKGRGSFQDLQSISRDNVSIRKGEELASHFSDEASLTVAVNSLPVPNFLH